MSERERLLEEGRGDESDRSHVEDEKDGVLAWCFQCCRSKAELTQDEREVAWLLRRRVVNEPAPPRSVLEDQCLAIWNAAFPEEHKDSFETGQAWKRLGFQGKDPATDVRTGAFCLEQLHRVALRRPELLHTFAAEASDGRASFYLFAIACFNISHMLVMFFDVYTAHSVSPVKDAPRATKRQLKHLLRLILSEGEASTPGGAPGSVSVEVCRCVLDELFIQSLTVVHHKWLEMTEKPGSKVNIMQFPEALETALEANVTFWNAPCDRLADLRLTR